MDANLVSKQTKILSDFIFETNFDDFPDLLLDSAKLIISDTMGVGFRGSLEPEMQSLYAKIPKGGKAVLFKAGLPKTNCIAMAGFANATAICFLELDPLTMPATHGGLTLLPPALALAQFYEKSGADFLTAFILGYEVYYRIEKNTKLRKDVYCFGNSGNIGAVVTVGKLLKWNAEQFRQAINCAASVPLATSWPVCFTDSSISSTFASFSSPMALIVKDLIESGFTGYESALGDTFGNIIGTEFDPLAMTEGLGSDYAIMQKNHKFHTSCAIIHPAIEAAADALNYNVQHEHYPPFKSSGELNTDKIKKIKVFSGEERLPKLNFSPENLQSAKFSLPFVLATYLVTGSASDETINQSALNNDRIRSLEKRISLEFDPNASKRPNGKILPAEVSIEFVDGQILSGKCENIFGFAENPAGRVDLYNKFSALTNNVLNESEKNKIWDTMNNIEKQKNMAEIF